MTNESTASDVLPMVVVGAGPVGLVAALAARHHGIQVVVLEAEPEGRFRPGSRAVYLYRESLDLLERIAPGVTEPLIEQSRSWTKVRTTFRARDVYVRTFPAAPAGKFGISVAQPAQEKVLFERCLREGVEFRWSHQVEGVTTDRDGVTLQIAGGETVRAHYVVASDGARSAVRSGLGIELDGTRSNTAFIIVDLAANENDPKYNERAFHYQHPAVGGRNVLVVPFGGGLRVDLQCSAADDVDSLQRDPKLSEWVGAVAGPGFDLPPLWVTTYRFHRSVATSYTDANAKVLLAGEAAHLFPPFGGARGLNSGIPDAVFEVEAIADALRATDPAEARAHIVAVAEERRSAGLGNREAASAALQQMEAKSWCRRARLRLASVVALKSDRVGRWLDRMPTAGSDVKVSERSRY
ncbi:MAG: FAD-dependent monooxygenase [Ilumatobacteraceae bacterium]